jgi:hypothetical protein
MLEAAIKLCGVDVFPYPYVVHHHLVQTGGTERALDDICDGLSRENFKESAVIPEESILNQ